MEEVVTDLANRHYNLGTGQSWFMIVDPASAAL